MNKKILIAIFILLIIGVATAGAVVFLKPYNPLTPPTVEDQGSTTEGITVVATANNKFNIDLYKKLAVKDTENIFVSPYSISSALAMTYEGANGTTAEEMKAAFYFPESNILRPNFAALYNIINKKDKKYELRTGNALWAQKDYKFLPEYFSTVEKYYGGKAVNLDFINETELSRNTINTFISEQTNNRIKDIIPLGGVNSATRLVISNAIYFKGKWDIDFDKEKTQDRDFKTPTGLTQVSTMAMYPKSEEQFNYYENENLQALELPYKDKELSMIVLLPKSEDGLSSLENEMDFEKLNEWTSNLKSTEVDEIYLPKFEFDYGKELSEDFKELGMVSAFSAEGADFSKMTGDRDLYISKVIHKAFVKVDEEGTEAAAATVVTMNVASALENPTPRIIFRADHPFIFMIRENSTGAILFMGRITNPSA
jgi:serine protease inhibitor